MCKAIFHHTSSFTLLRLPHELQLSVLKHLDLRSLLACKLASPALASIIDDNIRTLYQLQLESTGMVDGPRGNSSNSERLAHERFGSLCALMTAWASGEHPVYEVKLGSFQQSGYSMWHNFPPRLALEVPCIDRQDGSLRIYRPPGVFSGISFHVDLAQDLFIWCNGITSTPSPSLHFCSLANRFGPHRDATRPTISSCFLTYIERLPFVKIRVLGDIVAWSMYGGDTGSKETDLLVINWKTGVVVWHMHFPNVSVCAVLISQTQLCVLHPDNMSIYLYTFDPCACSDSKLSVFQDSFAVLRLPACHDRVLRKAIYGDIGLPPAYPHGTPYHFRHDPTHTLLAVSINLEYALDDDIESDIDERRLVKESFLLFIPVDTLLRVYHFTDPNVHYADAFPPNSIERLKSEPHRIIPWEQWGPSGTRMVHMQNARPNLESDVVAPPSVLGAYAALIVYCPSEHQYVTIIYEVHPLADAAAPLPIAKAGSTSIEPGQGIHRPCPVGDCIRRTKTWKDDIYTRFPYRTTTRTLPHCDTDGRPRFMDHRKTFLTHDGLVHNYDR
ncbi:hypothetical protein C8Q73DRAFT_166399 [Cubamyces lactineus]|nr:hypothetical protein C8Q73DRAFT_166399 [Cubamyces lactineus]